MTEKQTLNRLGKIIEYLYNISSSIQEDCSGYDSGVEAAIYKLEKLHADISGIPYDDEWK